MTNDRLFYEDIEIGARHSFGRYEVSREEVLDFARKYDPQPFHLDEEAAAADSLPASFGKRMA